MNTILKEFKGLEGKEWYYYNNNSTNEAINPFKDDIGHKKFIEDFFKRSGKYKVINDNGNNNFFNVDDIPKDRAPHTNSVFFLGIYLYHNTKLKDYIDKSLQKIKKDYDLFQFLWFLISIFHDAGYKYEKDTNQFNKISNIVTLRKKLMIRYDLLKYKKIKSIPAPFYNSIQKYFLYRKHSNTIDHGIIAGLYYYDALVKNRIKQEKASSNKNLYFGKPLNKIYAEAAAVIATHNIWLPYNKKDEEEYNKFGLTDLINISPMKATEAPIKAEEYPLFFLLGIVDTIDPVKAYNNGNLNCNEILDNILIKCEKSKITLQKAEGSQFDFNKMIEKAKNFEGWLDVTTELSEGKLIIKF